MARCSRERGFVLMATCIVLVVLLGLAGLGIDIARMYIIKSELQAFSDAAALNAALQLDGSARGLEQARQAAAQLATGPHAMKWDLGTRPIPEIAARFAPGDRSPDSSAWQAEPPSASDLRLVRITVSAPAPLLFLRAFPAGSAGISSVSATSVAAKTGRGARLIQ